MAQFRNVSADERMVVYGVPSARTVTVDGVVDVDDDAAGAYESQPAIWRRVDIPADTRPSLSALKEKVAADEAALAAAEAGGTPAA